MKQFKGCKKTKDIVEGMEAKGFVADTNNYDKGGDFIFFEGGIYLNDDARKADVKLPVMIAVGVLGSFFVKSHLTDKIIATENSAELDGEPWYLELLDTIYVQSKKGGKNNDAR